jgi:hypothetical protein
MWLEVTPAYGRDYRSAKAAKEDWAAGKDFKIASVDHPDCGRYVNKDDAPKGSTVLIRYRELTQVTCVKVK